MSIILIRMNLLKFYPPPPNMASKKNARIIKMPSETGSDGISFQTAFDAWKSGNLGLMLVTLTFSDATQTVNCLALPAQE